MGCGGSGGGEAAVLEGDTKRKNHGVWPFGSLVLGSGLGSEAT